MEFYFQIKILKSLFDFDPKFRGSFDIKKKCMWMVKTMIERSTTKKSAYRDGFEKHPP